jgi:sec-independent protein translocase protein TatA
MLEGLFQPMHLLVIFGLTLLVFGPKKLPELGKGLGESIRGFKSAMKTEEDNPTSSGKFCSGQRLQGLAQWVLGRKSSSSSRSGFWFLVQNDCRQ